MISPLKFPPGILPEFSDGNIFVAERVPIGRVTKLRRVS
jgi:hypothetical protein